MVHCIPHLHTIASRFQYFSAVRHLAAYSVTLGTAGPDLFRGGHVNALSLYGVIFWNSILVSLFWSLWGAGLSSILLLAELLGCNHLAAVAAAHSTLCS